MSKICNLTMISLFLMTMHAILMTCAQEYGDVCMMCPCDDAQGCDVATYACCLRFDTYTSLHRLSMRVECDPDVNTAPPEIEHDPTRSPSIEDSVGVNKTKKNTTADNCIGYHLAEVFSCLTQVRLQQRKFVEIKIEHLYHK
jgi:hypothetical protein